MNRRVVVTGMAIWSPYGCGVDAFWDGIVRMQPGKKEITRFDVSHWVFRSKDGATIPEIPGNTGGAEVCSQQIMARVISDLLGEIGQPPENLSPYDIGLCLGSSNGGATSRFMAFLKAQRGEEFDPAEFRGSRPRLSSAAFLSDFAEQLGCRGPSALISTACASGTSSIGIGYDWIRQGRAHRVFAGGYGYFSDISLTGFNILRLVGKNGCRPFDAARDGMMLGDGFALVALEDEEAARARNAKILARIVGYCAVNEAHHPTSPDPTGDTGLRVMWNALGRSEEHLARLDYINAHGTGTEVNDKVELSAIRRLLSNRHLGSKVPISSTKGHHGHSLGATGSVEFIATVLAMRHGCVPATLGLERPEPGFHDIDLVQGTARKHAIRIALSNSFAFGGNVAAIAIERVD